MALRKDPLAGQDEPPQISMPRRKTCIAEALHTGPIASSGGVRKAVACGPKPAPWMADGQPRWSANRRR